MSEQRWLGLLCAPVLILGLGCVTPVDPTQPTEAERLERQGRAKYNLGIDHLNEGRNAIALRELLAAERFTPRDPWLQIAIAEAYRRQNLTAQALVHLVRALEIEPDLPSARLNMSAVYMQRGEYANAAREAAILAEDPTFPTPWNALSNLGYSQLQLGKLREARRNLTLAVEYNPRYWPAVLNLGILEQTEGNRLPALEQFQKVLDLEPGPLPESEAHYRTAEILIALGQQEKAVRHLVAVAKNEPNGEWGRKSEKYLKLLR